jgi:Zn-finger protein
MSYRFFQNTACEYYPCHDMDEINCLFCFCPLYRLNCPGSYVVLEGSVKDCSNCTFPHRIGNYESVIRALAGKYCFGVE